MLGGSLGRQVNGRPQHKLRFGNCRALTVVRAFFLDFEELQAVRRGSFQALLGPPASLPSLDLCRMHPRIGKLQEARRTGSAAGILNQHGEYNCFLNVVVQSLWHLRSFQDVFQDFPAHEHPTGKSTCVLCSLYVRFTASQAFPQGDQDQTDQNLCFVFDVDCCSSFSKSIRAPTVPNCLLSTYDKR